MWVKICGIRDVSTAIAVAKLRPDAIGLNFYAPSPRCVDAETARDIVRALPPDILPVGVFVNHSLSEIEAIVSQVKLKAIQLHGDEPIEFLGEVQQRFPDLPLIRAWRTGTETLADLAEYLADCHRTDVRLWGCLIDARVTGSYGGSGQTSPWDLLAREYRAEWPRLILAGGLTPENIAAGIIAVRPFGVDVASGVESSAGVKDLSRVEKFIRQSR